MREIKFRIWDKQNRHWITENGYSLHCNSNWAICPFTGKLTDYVGLWRSGEFGEDYAASPAAEHYLTAKGIVKEPRYVVVQCTGLKDSKGKEIYEGDIVEFKTPVHGNLVTDTVVFDNGSFILEEMEYNLSDTKVRVIGNIFETPELLKQ